MLIPEKPSGYRVYLIRCWQEPHSEPGPLGEWRFAVEEARSGRKRGFPNLQALLDYLRADLALAEDTPPSGK